MTEGAAIGALAAFAAGIVSFLSPCVLPLVPAYVSYIAGDSYHRRRRLHAEERLAALGLSTFFVAGFSTVFIALGASATALGQLFLRFRYEANLVDGVIVIAFGLFMLGLWRWVPWLLRDLRPHPHLRGAGTSGVGLLAAYALGLGLPFLFAALFADRAARLLGKLRGIGAALQMAGGMVLVAFGIAMITGRLAAVSIWLLNSVPALGSLG